MIKNNLFLFYAFLAFLTRGYSQNDISSFSVIGGVTGKNSYGGILNYNYTTHKSVIEAGAYYNMFEDTSYKPINYTVGGIKVGYLYNVISSRGGSFLLFIGGGGTGGYQQIQNPNNYMLVSKNGFEYGTYACAQIDLFLSRRMSFIVRVEENYSISSNSGEFNPFGGIGLKYNL